MGREDEENTQADQMPALWTLQDMGEDMTDEEFNRYCAEVLGYKYGVWASSILPGNNTWEGYKDKDGYAVNVYAATDLNQMAEVFDKLWQIDDIGFSMITLREKGLARAMREFIESTTT